MGQFNRLVRRFRQLEVYTHEAMVWPGHRGLFGIFDGLSRNIWDCIRAVDKFNVLLAVRSASNLVSPTRKADHVYRGWQREIAEVRLD